MMRKSRKDRIGVSASFDKNAPRFCPTDAEWEAIEAAYEHRFSPAQKMLLGQMVQQYFDNQPLEGATPFADSGALYLNNIEETAKNFVRALALPKVLTVALENWNYPKNWN